MLKIILVECLNVKLIGFINFPLLFEMEESTGGVKTLYELKEKVKCLKKDYISGKNRSSLNCF